MNKFFTSHSLSFKKCRDFAVANKPSPPPAGFNMRVTTLSESIDGMGKAAAKIGNNPISKACDDLAAARLKLRKEQVALRQIAYGLDYDSPGVIKLFRVPQEKVRLEIQLETARAALSEARTFKDKFIENGRPPNFLDKLDAAIKAVEAQQTVVNGLMRERREGFKELELFYESGRKSKAYLNGIFCSLYDEDSAKLASWNEVHQVNYHRDPRTDDEIDADDKKEQSTELAQVRKEAQKARRKAAREAARKAAREELKAVAQEVNVAA